MIGRLLTSQDDKAGGQPVAVISDTLWHQRFGGDVGAIGSTITFDRKPVTIVGVAPRTFMGLEVGRSFDMILPIRLDGDGLDDRAGDFFELIPNRDRFNRPRRPGWGPLLGLFGSTG